MKGRRNHAQRVLAAAARSFKVAARLLALLVLLAAALAATAVVVFRMMFTPEEVRAIAAAQLQEAFRRPVQVQDVNLVVYQGIRLRGLRVLEAPGFAGPDFLSSDVVLVKLRWWPLLHRRLELDEFRLVEPRIQLVRRADGVWNVGDLLTARGASRAPLSLVLAADRIVIENGSLTVRDLERSVEHGVGRLNCVVQDFDPTAPFPVSVSFDAEATLGSRRVAASWALDATARLAGLRLDEAELDVHRARVTAHGRSATVSGRIRGLRLPRAELRLRLPALDSEYLGHFMSVPPGVSLPATEWRGTLSRPSTGQLELTGLELESPGHRLAGSATLNAAEDGWRWRATGSATGVALGDAARWWRTLESRKLAGTVDATATARGVLGRKGVVVEQAAVQAKGLSWRSGDRHRVAGVDGRLTVRDEGREALLTVSQGSAWLYGVPLQGLDLIVRRRGDALALERVRLAWEGSHLALTGKVDGIAPPRAVAIDGRIDRVSLEKAVAMGLDVAAQLRKPRPGGDAQQEGGWSRAFKRAIPKTFPAVAGKLKVGVVEHSKFKTNALDAEWDLKGIAPGLQKLGGFVRVGFGPGSVYDIPYFEASHKILKVLFLPFVFMHKLSGMSALSLQTAYPTSLDFRRIYGVYGLRHGEVDMRVFHVDSEVLQAYAEGTIDFPKEKVKLNILTRLDKARQTLPELFVDTQGRPAIGFDVYGDLNHPDLSLHMSKMEEDAIEQALRRGLERSRAQK